MTILKFDKNNQPFTPQITTPDGTIIFESQKGHQAIRLASLLSTVSHIYKSELVRYLAKNN